MAEKNKTQRGKVIRVGPKMMEVIDIQKSRVLDATFNVVDVSNFDCCEILAKKFKSEL